MNPMKQLARITAVGRCGLFLLVAAFLATGPSAQAGAIRTHAGFTNLVFGPNDDETYPCTDAICTPIPVPLGFNATFYGNTFSQVYVNNNGNVTFDSPLFNYTPFGLADTTHQIIAAFFADVDTRGGTNYVTLGNDVVDGHAAFGVNWIRVGYYFENTDKLNSFQLILIDRSDRHAGDFDIEFNYEQVRWETGDASDGVGGLGGFSAVVGFSDGTGQPGTSFQLPGSLVPGTFLDGNPGGLIHGSFNSTVPGRYIFPIVNLPDTVLNVPLFRQGDPPWASQTYDSSGFTVQQKGSALCSLAMALKYAGINTDPGALNTFLTTHSNFIGSGINWDTATRDASGNTLRFHAYRTTDINYLKQILGEGRPIIVGVNRNADGAPGHFVLVTGWQGGQFLINDPGYAGNTTLSAYLNDFETRGFVENVSGDVSGLDISVDNAANFLLVDPAGRRAGRSPILGVVQDIPQSVYFADAVLDDEMAGTPGSDTAHLVPIFQPTLGTYLLYVIGNQSGAYKLTLRSFAQNGASQTPVVLQGTTTPGAITRLQVILTSTGISVSPVSGGVVPASLASFTEFPEGSSLNSDLVLTSDGVLYGTARTGGVNGYDLGLHGYGTVFKFNPDGTINPMYYFGSVEDPNFPYGLLDGIYPRSGLIMGDYDFLLGTTSSEGPNGYGSVFMIGTNGTMSTLYGFGGVFGGSGQLLDGANPYGRLLRGQDGDFYGTTMAGGQYEDDNFNGYGTVFKLDFFGQLTTLHHFGAAINANGSSLDGAHPYAGLVQSSNGTFYGTTETGGAHDCGTVFKVTPGGAFATLYSFGTLTNSSGVRLDGANPHGALVFGHDGHLYGTTSQGGSNDLGTAFRITTNGAFTLLSTFNGHGNGGAPEGGLIRGADGNFYGTTFYGGAPGGGTAFSLTPAGALTTLYSFVGAADGARPADGLLQAPDGSFYGTTSIGGTNGGGTVFRFVLPPTPPVFQTVTRAGGTLIATWSAVLGRSYQVQYRTNLAQINWLNLGSPVVATNATMPLSDAIAPTGQKYYRIHLLP